MQNRELESSISVIDLFCGGGGLTYGLQKEGLPVNFGIDIDVDCQYPYEQNNDSVFLCENISELEPEKLSGLFKNKDIRVLVGCAPCQPFSAYSYKSKNTDWQLLITFSNLIKETLPEIVSMENVPQLTRFQNGRIFKKFVSMLGKNGYSLAYNTLYGPDFGLPQSRSRLVLLASRLGKIELPIPTHAKKHKTVRDAIGKLPSINAGETCQHDPLHRSRSLSETNLKRIKSSKPGGTWHDWDAELRAKCHTKPSGQTYSSVYGRMLWNKPSPTLTTQFCGFGNGRFGHPEQDRALSLREGAILQGFPESYRFFDQEQPSKINKISQIIGNAVPVDIGRAIGRAIIAHIGDIRDARS